MDFETYCPGLLRTAIGIAVFLWLVYELTNEMFKFSPIQFVINQIKKLTK